MKLEVTEWFKEAILSFMGKAIEIILRIILFFLPLGLFLTLLQFRGKASKVSNISVYTNSNSVWQHIFPGFILIATDPEMFKNIIKDRNNKFQTWLSNNKFTIFFILIVTIIIILTYAVVRYF